MSTGVTRAGVHVRRVVFNANALSLLALVLFVALLHAAVTLGARGCALNDPTFRCQVVQFIAG